MFSHLARQRAFVRQVDVTEVPRQDAFECVCGGDRRAKRTPELSDAGGQWRPNGKLTRPARDCSSDFVGRLVLVPHGCVCLPGPSFLSRSRNILVAQCAAVKFNAKLRSLTTSARVDSLSSAAAFFVLLATAARAWIIPAQFPARITGCRTLRRGPCLRIGVQAQLT